MGEVAGDEGRADWEGYLAPVFVLLMFITSALRLPDALNVMLGVLCWACALLFAISGVRRGRLGARVASGLVLAFLFFQIAFSLMLLYH